ncbi:MAG: hypothetical protein HZA03_09145 [Nitrospinae bacterium]|nr:hypothetical protein [Nitrospinota bacterium]
MMRFLFLTSPVAKALPELLGRLRRAGAVKVLNFTVQPGMEGVGMLEAASRFDAEHFARTFGRESGSAIRLLPL